MSVYIIAEAGVSHNGNMDTAYEMIKVAADAGADAVKFQAFNSQRLKRPELKKYELMKPQYYGLERCCREHGVDFLCSCFDTVWLKALEPLMPRIKIASSKVGDKDFITACDKTGKELLISTGLADEYAIEDVMRLIYGKQKTVLMHCVTDYPPEVEDLNLASIKTMIGMDYHNTEVGYSDHTIGESSAIMAVALGATVIEKHFTLDNRQDGPDHHMSLEPWQLNTYIIKIRNAEKMLGDGVIRVEKGAEKNLYLKEQYNLSKEN
jgi:N,N'-diacetyllegionaminate synthase